MLIMLSKGRKMFMILSQYQLFIPSISYSTLILLSIIINNNVSSIYGIALKYNGSEIDQKLSLKQSQSSLSRLELYDTDFETDDLIPSIYNVNKNNNFNNINNRTFNKTTTTTSSTISIDEEYFDQLSINNPCLVHYCQKGRECIIDTNTSQPTCICQRQCSHRKRPICGSNGRIYKNHCRLHQASCLLNTPITYQRLENCLKNETSKISDTLHNKHIHSKSSVSNLNKYHKQQQQQLSSTIMKNNDHYQNLNDMNDSNPDENNEEDKVKFDEQEKKFSIHKEAGKLDLLNHKEQHQYETNLNDGNDNSDKKSVKKFTKIKGIREKENNEKHNDDRNSSNIIINDSYFTKVPTFNGRTSISFSTTTNNSSGNSSKINLIEQSILEQKKICTSQEYEIMKDNLLLFNHARLMSQDNNHSKDFLVSIMFSHYDQNNDAYLEIEELNQISFDEHLEELSNGCILEDMLNFDDLNGDGKLSINEFYQAFSKLYSVSVVSLDKALETNHLSARVGDNVEIKCDVTGSPSPPIIWRRDDIDLSTLNMDDIRVFSDGSLYLTRIQLVHSGNYTCHAQRNKDVVQTHILNVYTIPQVLVMPRIQSKRPGENAEMWCHVTGDPLPKVEWLKNDEKLNLNIPDKYEVIGNGTALRMRNIQYSDTGAYMCQATNIGGTVRDISSLIIQEEPTPTVLNEERKFFVFHESGISIYEPSTCRLYHQIQGTDIIPGTQEYVCGDKNTKCSWGRSINVGTHYIYATQPTLDRVLVISTIQMVVVDVVQTDKYPVELYYVQKFDQIWVLNWRSKNNVDAKIIQVIREAGQKRKHHTVHPEPIDGQFDLVRGLFIPSSDLEQPHFSYNYGYVTHKNQRGLYKLDLANLRYTKSVDLTLHNCVPEYIVFSALYGFVILTCREPITNRPQGQLVLDYLTDAVLTTKPSLYGIPKISPDSRHLVTIQHNPNEVVIVVQKITRNGLEFLFDVKTTLNISDVTFYESQTMHGYDLFASSNDKENILYLNLCTGKVEMITGVGLPIPMSSVEWGNPGRVIRSSGLFGLYMLTTANNALFVINGRERTVNCEIGGVEHPTSIVWTHSLQSYYATNLSPYLNEL